MHLDGIPSQPTELKPTSSGESFLSRKVEKEEVNQVKKKRITQINSRKEPIPAEFFAFRHHPLIQHLQHHHHHLRPEIGEEETEPGERHAASPELHPVMTCFTEPGLNVNKSDKFGMGANGSALQSGTTSTQPPRQRRRSSDGGRLKSRSQSSYALDCIKVGGSNNNGSHPCEYPKENGGGGGLYYNLSTGGKPPPGDGLSNSIPADLWDLPPNSQSYSPCRYRRKMGSRSGHQQDGEQVQPSRKTKFMQLPVLEALINLSKKGGRARAGRGTEPPKMSSRSKLYAASCPDVTQHGNNENVLDYSVATKMEHEDDNVRASQPVLYHRETSRDQMDGDGSQSKFCLHHHSSHQKLRQRSWTELQVDRHRSRQKSCEDNSYGPAHSQGPAMSFDYPAAFPFISEDAIFQVSLQRDHRGLGLGFSVSGGADSQEPFAGLIRVKKVFPTGPAFQSGKIQPWDILLKANGISLIGLTNHEALEVLRTTPTETLLTVCRPPPLPELRDRFDGGGSQPQLSSGKLGTPCPVHHGRRPVLTHHNSTDSPRDSCHQVGARDRSLADSFSSIASLSSFKSKSLTSLKIPSTASKQPSQVNKTQGGEFEVTLEKVAGSLGFTLRQDEFSGFGHCVRELVKPPALGDGRIQPGDRILSVNSVDIQGMSHVEAVTFLRQLPARVTLRLYRELSPTPISADLSPESHRVVIKDKTYRQEAIDMIHEMKERKQMSASPDPKFSLPGSSAASGNGGCPTTSSTTGLLRGYKQAQIDANGSSSLPRRRPGLVGMTPSPEVISAALDRFAGRPTQKSNQSPELSRLKPKVVGSGPSKGCPLEARSSGSGESTPAGTINNSNRKAIQDRCASSTARDSDAAAVGTVRKPSFRQYTMHLDRISSLEDESFSSDLNQNDSIVSAPGFGTGPTTKPFRPGQPAYQSAVFPATTHRRMMDGGGRKNLSLSKEEMEQYGQERRQNSKSGGEDAGHWSQSANQQRVSSSSGSKDQGDDATYSMPPGLSKWKGLQFQAGNDDEEEDEEDQELGEDENLDSLDGSSSSLPQRSPAIGSSDGPSPSSSAQPPPPVSSSLVKKSSFLHVENGGKLSQRQSPDGREFHEGEMNLMEVSSSEVFNGEEIITVQLSRKWCSRLGFSIKGSGGHTFITAIYADSVAGRDGRLHVGDELIMVNNESIRNMETGEVIELMRTTRGVITITLMRKHPITTAGEELQSPESPLDLT